MGSLAAEVARGWLLANRRGQGIPGYSAAAGELMANSAISAAVNVAVAGFVLLMADLSGPLVCLAHALLWGSLVYLGFVIGLLIPRAWVLGVIAHAAARLPFVGRQPGMDPVKMRDMERTIRSVLAKPSKALARTCC
jgi:hypothetical protein